MMVVVDEQGRVGAHEDEAEAYVVGRDPLVPGMWGLFQPMQQAS